MTQKNTRLDLFKSQVADGYSRDNYANIINFIRDVPLFKGKFEFLTLSIGSAVTNVKFPHNLGFAPIDVIVTRLSDPSATFYLNTDRSDSQFLDVTTNMAVDVRMFIGRYDEPDV